jgi:hypothetical protein
MTLILKTLTAVLGRALYTCVARAAAVASIVGARVTSVLRTRVNAGILLALRLATVTSGLITRVITGILLALRLTSIAGVACILVALRLTSIAGIACILVAGIRARVRARIRARGLITVGLTRNTGTRQASI